MTANQPIYSISLNTAAALTGRSIRTWQRRIEEGLVPRLNDARERALVPFDAVQPALAVALSDEDVQTLVRADQGNVTAQAEIGALFALAALNEPKSGGGGAALYPRFTSLPGLRSWARQMQCIGLASCTPPDWARKGMTAPPWH